LDVVGYLKDRPMEIIKGKITGLPIPANAEIAIEGFSPPRLGLAALRAHLVNGQDIMPREAEMNLL